MLLPLPANLLAGTEETKPNTWQMPPFQSSRRNTQMI